MWKVHVMRNKLLQLTFLTRSFSRTPHWHPQAGRLLKKEGKENMVTSCVGLRKSAVTLIHCCDNSIIYKLCGAQTAVNNVPHYRLSNQTPPLVISMAKSDAFNSNVDRSIGFRVRTAQGWNFIGLSNFSLGDCGPERVLNGEWLHEPLGISKKLKAELLLN